ncbi:MAG: hypothetical protein KGI38_11150 [Thaumarchaeota archaeon]|nr:hypothetical protein [Nitrososphaerota archaeon]
MLIFFLMLLDLARVTVGTEAIIPIYSALSIVLGLLQGVLLLAAAQGIYFGAATTLRSFPGELAKHKVHAVVFLAFTALAAVVVLFFTVVQPPPAVEATDFAGNSVPSMFVSPSLFALVVGIFVFFLAYPTTLMLVSASKVEDKKLRRSIIGLGFGWAVVSGLYVLTETYSWTYGVDATGMMYAADAVIFYAVIRNFRRSASLAGFVEERVAAQSQGAPRPQAGLSPLAESLAGKKVLYEVDPTVPYEATLGKTLEELAWVGNAVFVFTPKASPLHDALSGGTGIKFFLTTSGVSYMKVAEDTREVLIPQSDTAIFLDVADKTLASRRGKVVVVFDNVSELLLMAGIEKTYKFLKQFLELLNEPTATGFFIFIKSAHEPKDINLLKGIFPNHFVEDAAGPRLVK